MRQVLTRPGALIAESVELFFGFKIRTRERRNKIFKPSKTGHALVDVDLDLLLLELKEQEKVSHVCTKTQMCDFLMVPFMVIFGDGRAALRKDMCLIKCGGDQKAAEKINWEKRVAPLEKADVEERRARIEQEDEEAEVAREASLRQAVADQPRKRKAPEPNGANWEAMYLARAHALARERLKRLAEQFAEATRDTDNDDDQDALPYEPVSDDQPLEHAFLSTDASMDAEMCEVYGLL